MSNILVTGGAGFIGFHLSKALVEAGHEVTLVDNLFRGQRDDALEQLLSAPKARFIQADLTQRGDWEKLGGPFDQVYHLAAINGTRYFYEVPHLVLRVNLLCIINLLDWLTQKECGHILFASSSENYAGTARAFGITVPTPEDVPLTIEDVHNPRLSYAGSKIAGELLILSYARNYRWNASIVRYHNIYGPRMGYEHVIPQFSQRIARREDPFPIYGAEQTRAFCYVDDAVWATINLMVNPNAHGQVVNVGNDQEEISISKLAHLMFELTHFHPKEEVHSAPEGSVDRRCPDLSRLRSLTGYQPKVSLTEGLSTTYTWYSSHLQPLS